MTGQTIQSQDISVADVFHSFYVVPDYQREYVWNTEQVEQLLNDINAEIDRDDPAKAPEYFIGSIVVCPGSENVLELIDGQQRMTTLFIILCAIRDRIQGLGEQELGALGSQISAASTDAAGRDQFRYRLDLQYEDSGDVLVNIAAGKLNDVKSASTRSSANIRNAYKVTRSFLVQEFADDADKVRAFYGYLTNKVKLIRIETKDVANALKIFETINDRGVGLDSMDLLKNLLFMKASRDEFEKLKTQWKKLQDAIFDMKEKPLRFLRYFIFSRYDVNALREDQIYSWFSANEETCGYGADPLGFVEELLSSAHAYRNFLNGCDQSGQRNCYLENLQLLGGKAARQHLILLLAGRHLQQAQFDQLAREIEDLYFIYVITRENTRDFEQGFARWSTELRKISDTDDLEAFISRRFVPTKVNLSARFDEAFRHIYANSVQIYRLRYILAKLTQYIDLNAYGETEGTRWLKHYVEGGFDIEHIFAQNPSKDAAAEFGAFEDQDIHNRLVNLVLIEKSINASVGNRPYSRKQDAYRQSKLLLTKALAEQPKVGTNTRIDIAVADLDCFLEWNETAVIDRQDMLTKLARSVWHLPPIAKIKDAG